MEYVVPLCLRTPLIFITAFSLISLLLLDNRLSSVFQIYMIIVVFGFYFVRCSASLLIWDENVGPCHPENTIFPNIIFRTKTMLDAVWGPTYEESKVIDC